MEMDPRLIHETRRFSVKFQTERNVQVRGGHQSLREAVSEAKSLNRNYKNVWIERTTTIIERVWEV